MKQRYRDWANLTGAPKKQRPAVARLIDLPEVRDLERRELLNSRSRVKSDYELNSRIDEVSRKHFGITERDTIFITEAALNAIKRRDPEEGYELEQERDEHEEQFFCKPARTIEGQAKYLRSLGWDVMDDDGRPMQLLERFARQIEAAEKMLCGARRPDFDAIKNQNWDDKIAREARQFMSRKKSLGSSATRTS